jgi:hypothetical protein
MIPTMAFHVEGTYVPNMGTDEATRNFLRKNVAVHHVFQPPFSTLPSGFAGLKTCPGTEMIGETIRELLNDENCHLNQDI